jgi:O-antigen/teichoic acid export membrane protein
MSLTARIAQNTIIQVIGKAVAVLFGIAVISLLTRHLGKSGFGAYTTVVSFVQFFGTLADLGLYIVTVKKISEHNGDTARVFNNIFTLRVFSALVFVVLVPCAVLLFPYPNEVKVGVAIVSAINFFLTLTQVLTGVFQKELAMVRASIAEVAGKAVFFGLIAWLVTRGASLNWFLGALVFGSAIQCVLLLFFVVRYQRIQFAFDWDIWRQVLSESWPVAISVALNLIYFRADTIILSLFHSQATVGVYGASYKVLEVLVAIPAIFAGLIMPIATRHASANNSEGFQSTLQKGFDFLATIGLPIVAGVFVLARPIMTFIAGREFAVSGPILQVLVFAVGIIFLGTLFGYTVVSVNRQRDMIKFYFAVAVFSLIGYFVFIPPFSVWGAAGMTVATECAIMASGFYVVWRATRFRLSGSQSIRALAASVFMGCAVAFLPLPSVLLSVAMGVFVYAIALGALGGLRLDLIREIFRMR